VSTAVFGTRSRERTGGSLLYHDMLLELSCSFERGGGGPSGIAEVSEWDGVIGLRLTNIAYKPLFVLKRTTTSPTGSDMPLTQQSLMFTRQQSRLLFGWLSDRMTTLQKKIQYYHIISTPPAV